jgi:ribosomal protein L6P/L9E
VPAWILSRRSQPGTPGVRSVRGYGDPVFGPVRAIPMRGGAYPVAEMAAAVDAKTRLVTLCAVSFAPGFRTDLEINGVGYRAAKAGSKLTLALGYSHPIEINPPAGITFEVDGQTKVSVLGHDKELVGQIAAEIRSLRKPEPYKGKGVKYANEVIRRKAGKAGKVGAK